MTKRELLLALAKGGELTPERAIELRLLSDFELQSRIKAWGVTTPEVLDMVGLHFKVPSASTKYPHKRAEDLLELFLAALGLEDYEVVWVTLNEAEGASLTIWWSNLLTEPAPAWAVAEYPFRVAKLIGMLRTKPWDSLKILLEHNVMPFGLDEKGRFLVVDGSKDVR